MKIKLVIPYLPNKVTVEYSLQLFLAAFKACDVKVTGILTDPTGISVDTEAGLFVLNVSENLTYELLKYEVDTNSFSTSLSFNGGENKPVKLETLFALVSLITSVLADKEIEFTPPKIVAENTDFVIFKLVDHLKLIKMKFDLTLVNESFGMMIYHDLYKQPIHVRKTFNGLMFNIEGIQTEVQTVVIKEPLEKISNLLKINLT